MILYIYRCTKILQPDKIPTSHSRNTYHLLHLIIYFTLTKYLLHIVESHTAILKTAAILNRSFLIIPPTSPITTKVYFRSYKRHPSVPILKHIYPVNSQSHFLQIYLKIILSFAFAYSKWSLPSGLHTKIPCTILTSPSFYIPAHYILLRLITRNNWMNSIDQ